MKKIFLALLLITNLSFGAKFKDIQKWYPITAFPTLKNKLQEGDIIIYKPIKENFTQSFGHVAIIGYDKKLIDFPNPKIGFREIPFDIIASGQFRELAVLRYKYMTSEFKEKLLKELYSTTNKKYFILSFPEISKNTTYCSLFIYSVYENIDKTQQEIFPLNYGFVLPKDFLDAGQNFYIVNFE